MGLSLWIWLDTRVSKAPVFTQGCFPLDAQRILILKCDSHRRSKGGPKWKRKRGYRWSCPPPPPHWRSPNPPALPSQELRLWGCRGPSEADPEIRIWVLVVSWGSAPWRNVWGGGRQDVDGEEAGGGAPSQSRAESLALSSFHREHWM